MEMNYNNSKFSILLPLVIAGSVLVGIFMAKFIAPPIIQEEQVYVPTGDKIQDVINIIGMSYVDNISRDSLTDIMISNLLHNLDPHSTYMSAKETAKAESELTGNFVGIGIRFYVLHDTVMVTNIIKGGASEKVGLKPGDKIIDVDDKPISGIGISNDSVRGRILGEEGEIVKLSVLRDGEMLEFNISRKPVEVESVYYAAIDDIGYIKVTSFSDNTPMQFREALAMLKIYRVKSLVIDLRDNSGGYMGAAQEILDNFFTQRKLIVYTEGANMIRKDVYTTGMGGSFSDYPLAVLVNENSASASEITAGVIQDYDMGWVIGNVTFGKGLVQQTFNMTDGSSIRLTVSKYYLPSGRCIQRNYKQGYVAYIEDFYTKYGKNKQNVDSTKVFYTLNKKRKVYEGDGLMPDITVEHDTSYYNNMVVEIAKTNVISDFCVEYFDMNREKILKNITTKKALEVCLEKDRMFDKFLNKLTEINIKYAQSELEASRKYLKMILSYQIASYVLDVNLANLFLLDDDPYMNKAKEVLKKQ